MRLQSGSFAQCRHVCGVKAQVSLCRVSGWEMEIFVRSPWTLGCAGRMTCCGSSQLMHGVGLSSVSCLAFLAVTSLSSEAHISVCVEVEREWPAQDHETCRLLWRNVLSCWDWRCHTSENTNPGPRTKHTTLNTKHYETMEEKLVKRRTSEPCSEISELNYITEHLKRDIDNASKRSNFCRTY